jgi:hypothetical protein
MKQIRLSRMRRRPHGSTQLPAKIDATILEMRRANGKPRPPAGRSISDRSSLEAFDGAIR